MAGRNEAAARSWKQNRTYLVLAAFAWVASVVMAASDPARFEPYFGDAHPVAVLAVVASLGLAAVLCLGARGWSVIRADATSRQGWLRAVAIATAFAAAMVVMDAIAVPFSADINVPVPGALLFYPVMAFVVEVIFHLVPLALSLFVVARLGPNLVESRRVWASVLVVALLEPIFQVALAANLPRWMNIYLPVHLFAFSLVQLWLFRRHDLLTMIAFRLVYYLLWHIVWGHLRLQLLF